MYYTHEVTLVAEDLNLRVLFAGLPNSGKALLLERILYGNSLKKRKKAETLEYHKAKVKYLNKEFTLTFVDLPTKATEKYLNEKYLNDIDLFVCIVNQEHLKSNYGDIQDLYWHVIDVIPSVDVLLCVCSKNTNSVNESEIISVAKDMGTNKYLTISLSESSGATLLLKKILTYAMQKKELQ